MINLTQRAPVPGSHGAPVDQGITVHISTNDTVPLGSVIITINGVDAYKTSAFQTGFSGTTATDGVGGWTSTVTPTAHFTNNSTVTIRVRATDIDGAFDQTYTFITIRDIQLTVHADYVESGNIVDGTVYVSEGLSTLVPQLVQTITVQLLRTSAYAGGPNVVAGPASTIIVPAKSDAEGVYRVRLLNPDTVGNNLLLSITVLIDGMAAPNVGNLSALQPVNYLPVDNTDQLGAQQPDISNVRERPRLNVTGADVSTLQENVAQYETIDMAGTTTGLLVSLDFLNIDGAITQLTGEIQYSGGGNRLVEAIVDSTELIFQNLDASPNDIGGRTYLDPARTNLFPISDLSTNPFIITTTDNTVATAATSSEIADNGINQIRFSLIGGGSYGPVDRHVIITSPKVPVSPGNPVLVSFLTRTVFPITNTTLDGFVVRVKFYNNMSVLVGTQVFTYGSPKDFAGDMFQVVEAAVASVDVPGSTATVAFEIDLSSFESGDQVDLYVAAPMVEYGKVATSRVVGVGDTTVSQPDVLAITKAGNINLASGRLVISFSPEYSDHPPQTAVIFDTRKTNGLDGYYAFHRTDGVVEFQSVDPTGVVKSLASSPINFVAGQEETFVFEWQPASLLFKHDTVTADTFSGSYNQPTSYDGLINISNNSSGTGQLMGTTHLLQVYSNIS